MVGAAHTWRTAARLAGAPLLLAAVLWQAGPAAVVGALRRADAVWLVAGLASSLAFNALSALRWRHLLAWLGHELSAQWALAVTFRALALGSLLPGATVGGDLLRVWHLRRHGCTGAAAGMSVVLDRLSGLWMLWALAAAGLAAGAAAPELQPFQRALGLPGGAPLAPLGLGALLLVLTLPVALLAAWRASGRGQGLATLLRQPAPLRAYAWQATASLAAQAFSVASFACAARAFGIDLPMELIAITAAPIFLMAALPLSFGGWGTRELATVAAWSALGVAAPQATSASLAFGGYALVQAALGLMPVPRPATQLDTARAQPGCVPTSTG
ncbi:MAG TPA: lysylphosphatidylglycerol synthase transmembrane domain-containing protein [Burkholderiaceae bacterium]|nr:lysylphosphatidylglycerol synthase transmembrane domain-containing protein [Burkholderiaceae bacterium]